MPGLPDNSTDVVNGIIAVLNGPYTDAVRGHLEFEVYVGKANKGALVEFESALAYLATALTNGDAAQISHMESHCQRIAVETTEYIVESHLASIRGRFDPYYKHPRVARLLLLANPSFLDAHYETLRKIQEHIFQGRRLKGNRTAYCDCLEHFRKALRLAKELDKTMPTFAFGERLFALVLGAVLLILGVILGLMFK